MLQSALVPGGKLIRRRAQTWDNVTSPNCDVSKDIETSYEWSHEFFPNLRAQICGSNWRRLDYRCIDWQDHSISTLHFF